MPVTHYLGLALEEVRKETRGLYDPERNRSAFSTVYAEVESAWESWMNNVVDMLDVRHWRMNELITPKGELRNPKVYLKVSITTKGNLVLEWFPWACYGHSLENTDWRYWSDYLMEGSGIPRNRIVMIRDVGPLMDRHHDRPYQKSTSALLEAVQWLLRQVYDFLRRLLDVTIVTDLYLEYDEAQPMIDRLLTNVRIRPVKEVEAETEGRRLQQWYEDTFQKRLGMTPVTLLSLFKESGLKVGRLRRLLRERHSLELGETALTTIVRTLHSSFRDIYDSVIQDTQKAGPPLAGKVVDLNAVRDLHRKTVSVPGNSGVSTDANIWKKVTKDQLEALVWQKPTSAVAKDFGVSDVAVAKKCSVMGINKPGRGY